jgi:hypothetical protein
MTTIVTRAGKGSPLTNNEMDQNLINLNDDKVEEGAITSSGLTQTTARVLGRTTGGTGAIEELTSATVTSTFVDAGTTSAAGKLELATDAEAQAGTDTARAITPANMKAAQIVFGTSVSASGTSVDFTGIPSWAKRVIVMFLGVSTNGTSPVIVRLGTSGGVETTGYTGTAITLSSAANTVGNFTVGFGPTAAAAASIVTGKFVLDKYSSSLNTWVCGAMIAGEDAAYQYSITGRKTTADVLDRVRITTAGGTDTFDAGTINISWE